MGHHHSKASKSVCPTVDTSGPAIQPLVGGLTFHDISIIISGAAGGFAILIALFLIGRHATHFSNPPEQKQIIRIITVIPTFSIISFLCVWLDGKPQPYLLPGLDFGESLPMASFFLLMSAYIMPDEYHGDRFWEQLELIGKRGNPQGRGNLQLSFGVLQFIPVSIILWVATAISLAAKTYCITSNSIHFAHIWITILRMLTTAVAIMSILRLYGRLKSSLKPRGTMKQLVCFKILIFLNFIQTFVFNFLMSGGHLHANKYLTFNDLSKGLPSLILSCEMVLVAPFFLIACSVAPYKLGGRACVTGTYYGGRSGAKAILAALNVLDVIAFLVRGVKANLGSRNGGRGRGAESGTELLPPRR